MGDINIVTQPTTEVPPSVLAKPSDTPTSPEVTKPVLLSSTTTLQSSTAEQKSAASEVSQGLRELVEEQSKLIASMKGELDLLKSGAAKANSASADVDDGTIEEALADFFGYTE